MMGELLFPHFFLLETPMKRFFGIGLPRTATNSLAEALRLLGRESVKHEPNTARPTWLREHTDFVGGIPWAYADLEKYLPDAKFILTTRTVEDWLGSVDWLWRQKGTGHPYLRGIFDLDEFDEDMLVEMFFHHHRSILRYFQNKPEKLLVYRPGEGMERLAEFVGASDADWSEGPFPRLAGRDAAGTQHALARHGAASAEA